MSVRAIAPRINDQTERSAFHSQVAAYLEEVTTERLALEQRSLRFGSAAGVMPGLPLSAPSPW